MHFVIFSDAINIECRPKSKLFQSVEAVRIVLKQKNCAIYNGFVFKKIPESTKTFTYYKTVKSFLLGILSKPNLADVIASNIHQIASLLQEPDCRLIEPIKLDFNFIEVLNGYFFNIEQKKFEKNPTPK